MVGPGSWLDAAEEFQLRTCHALPLQTERRIWFFVTKMAEHFEYGHPWHRRGRAAALMPEYKLLLRSILESRPELTHCQTRCRHCEIIFVADPRNARRDDLGCPFGCQEEHRRRQSGRRSSAYYRDAAGKMKKQIQNAKRSVNLDPSVSALPPGAGPKGPNEAMVEHLMMMFSAIERRTVGRDEVLEFLRQRSIVERLGIGQDAGRPDGKPP